MKYKNIPSLLHNLGHSFTSDSNMEVDEKEVRFLAMKISQELVSKNIETLTLSLNPVRIICEAKLETTTEKSIKKSLEYYQVKFFEMARNENIDPEKITDLTLILTSRIPPVNNRRLLCEVTCRDDRSVKHSITVKATL